MKCRIRLALIIVTILCSLISIYGKGSPDKILITNDRACPIEINDEDTLKKFDPWTGQFVDWSKAAVVAPQDQSQTYEVLFFMKWPGRRSDYDRGSLKMIYTVKYVSGRAGVPGYIYLPGKGEQFYQNNVSTILRDGDDGKWHRASAAWDDVLSRLLRPDRQSKRTSVAAALLSIAFGPVGMCPLFGE